MCLLAFQSERILLGQAKAHAFLVQGELFSQKAGAEKLLQVEKSIKGRFRGSDVACGVLPYWECGIHLTIHDARLCFSLVYGKRHPATQQEIIIIYITL